MKKVSELSSPDIVPEIINRQVVKLTVGDTYLPLRKPIPLSEFPEFILDIINLAKYVNFSGKQEWRRNDVIHFLHTIRDTAQKFIDILIEYKDMWVPRETILTILRINKVREFSGALSSPGQYFVKYRKEPLYETSKTIIGGTKKYEYKYRINPKYFDLVVKARGGMI